MPVNLQEVLKSDVHFYRNNFRRAVVGLIIALIILIFLCFALFYKVANIAERKFYATTSDGRIMQLVPINPVTYQPERS